MYIATNNKVMFSEHSVFEGIVGDCHPSGGREKRGREMLHGRSAWGGGGCRPWVLPNCWDLLGVWGQLCLMEA